MKEWNLPKPAHACFSVDHLARQGYVVRDPDGKIVSSPTPFRTRAEQLRSRLQHEADAKAKRGPRPCLCCGAIFHSQGIHNRLCPNCRGRDDVLGEPHRPQIQR